MAVSATLAASCRGREVWHVYVLAVLAGSAQVFDSPGRHALVFQMVGRAELPNAIALNSSVFNASRIVGPGIAGLLIASVGVGACFAVNAVSFLAVLAALLLMRREELVPLDPSARPPTVMRAIGEGFAWAWRSPDARLVLLIVTVVSTVGFNFHVILPLLASDTLNTGPEVFGILSACFGGGALVGALLSATLGRASWKALVFGTGGFSVCLLALAPLTTVWLCAILLFCTGVCFTLWTSNASSILQLRAPEPSARPRGQPLPLGLRRTGAARRPARRLALRRRRHGAQLRRGRRDRPADGRRRSAASQRTTGCRSGVTSAPGSGRAPSSSGDSCS